MQKWKIMFLSSSYKIDIQICIEKIFSESATIAK